MGAFLIISWDLICNLWFFAEEKDNSVGRPNAPFHTTVVSVLEWHSGQKQPKASRAKKIPVFCHTSEEEQKGCYCDFQWGKMSKQLRKKNQQSFKNIDVYSQSL